MRTSTLICLFLLAAACGDAPEASKDRIELRPQWRTGDRFRVREEREQRIGKGRFPAAGEIESRTDRIRNELHIYDVEVVEADGHRLFRTRRTYLRSVRGEPGKLAATPVEGKTYEIVNPLPLAGLGRLEIRVVGEDGKVEPAPKEETGEIVKSFFRLTPTLLPEGPVERDGTWPLGRGLSTLDEETAASRVGIADYEAGRKARIEWRTSGRLRMRAPAETRVTIRESLAMDLANARIESYRSITEFHTAARPEQWRRISIDVTVTPRE
jgi:hypothetical protein